MYCFYVEKVALEILLGSGESSLMIGGVQNIDLN